VKLAEIEKSQFNFKIDELEKIAFDSRPVLKIMENEIVKNEYLYKLAQKDYYPNLNISLGYTQRDIGMDFISAMFSVNIPLFINKKQGKKVEETAYTIASVREGYIGMKNEIKYKIRELVHRIDEYNELFELLNQGIIPQASQSLRSAIAGYQVANVDFLTLLNNQMTLFDYEIEHYRILTDYEKSLADLEFILGKQLF
jgi:outer membrane protein TolC